MSEKTNPRADETAPLSAGDPAGGAAAGTGTGTGTATMERDEAPATPTADEGAVQASGTEGGPAKQRFTDRLWGWRAMLVVAVAAVILGGLAGAGIAHVSGGDSRDGRFGPGGRGGPGTNQGPGQGFPGQNNQRGQNGQGQQGFGPQQNGQNGQQGSGTGSTT